MIEHFITDHSQLSLIWFTYNIPNPWLFNVVNLTAVYLKSEDLISSSLSFDEFPEKARKNCILHPSAMLRRDFERGTYAKWAFSY